MSNYYDRYAPQADPAGLLKLGEATIAEQIAELNPEEDAATAAEAVLDTARTLIVEQIRQRVQASPVLTQYEEAILYYDWPEGDEHLVWVAEAPEEEIVRWAEAVEVE